jgi:hypothetical protein
LKTEMTFYESITEILNSKYIGTIRTCNITSEYHVHLNFEVYSIQSRVSITIYSFTISILLKNFAEFFFSKKSRENFLLYAHSIPDSSSYYNSIDHHRIPGSSSYYNSIDHHSIPDSSSYNNSIDQIVIEYYLVPAHIRLIVLAFQAF